MGDDKKRTKFTRSGATTPREKKPALHGVDKAGAGDLGEINPGEVTGKCPSCGAELRMGDVFDPVTQREQKALSHAVPFCSYFGETSPEEIMKAIGK